MKYDTLEQSKKLPFDKKRQYRIGIVKASTSCRGRLECSVVAAVWEDSSDLLAGSTVTTVLTSDDGEVVLCWCSNDAPAECRWISAASAVMSTDLSTSGCPPTAPFNVKQQLTTNSHEKTTLKFPFNCPEVTWGKAWFPDETPWRPLKGFTGQIPTLLPSQQRQSNERNCSCAILYVP